MMRRFDSVIGTGAGSSFIRLDELLHRLREKVEPLGKDVTVQNEIWNPASILFTFNLTV